MTPPPITDTAPITPILPMPDLAAIPEPGLHDPRYLPPSVPPRRRLSSRTKLIIASVTGGLLVLGGVGVVVAQSTQPPATVAVDYHLTLTGVPCSQMSYQKFIVDRGTLITVTDDDGNQLGSGKLGAGAETSDGCRFDTTFLVDKVDNGHYNSSSGDLIGSRDDFSDPDGDGQVSVDSTFVLP